MIWQDVAMSIAQVFFILSLVPSIISNDNKPKISLSLLTALGLFLVAISVYSLGAIYSGILTGIVCIEWLILGFQKLKRDNK